MEASTPKNGGKTASCASRMLHKFWCGYLHQLKNITTIPYHFILTLLNANFDFDVSVANDVTIDVAKCALPGKMMQGSPCPEVRTLANENCCYIMK